MSRLDLEKIKIICFDLFETLIFLKKTDIEIAQKNLAEKAYQIGIPIEKDKLLEKYCEIGSHYVNKSKISGIETYNRVWLHQAINELNFDINLSDPRLDTVVTHYFESFTRFPYLIEGTENVLNHLQKNHTICLLSNFTYSPAAHQIIENLNLNKYLDIYWISGDLGYRKPHPYVFSKINNHYDVKPEEVLFVGDNPYDDILGASSVGFQTMWSRIGKKSGLSLAAPLGGITNEIKVQSNAVFDSWNEFLGILEK